jgi:hypothetical protein
VYLGGPDGLLVQEGRYPLEGYGGRILTGDVNNDTYTDVVVLDRSGGVHVLLNRMGTWVTAVADDTAVPTHRLTLAPPRPNPFNPSTQLRYELPRAEEQVSLTVYNSVGQQVRMLVQGAHAAGAHSVTWDGCADDGRSVAAGVYVCRLEAGAGVVTQKVVKVE